MKRFAVISRLTVILASVAGALLAISAAAVPAAVAGVIVPLGGDPHGHPGVPAPRREPPGWNDHPSGPAQAHTLLTGGMPGWQIVLIAAGAALLAAALAVVVYRARAARRRAVASAA